MIYRLRDVVNNLKIPNPSYDQNYEYYVGSQWIALTKRVIPSLLQNEKALRRQFKNTFAPDELAIQSFIVNSLGKESNSLFAEDFDTYATISAPFHYLKPASVVATLEDLPEIISSQKFFVRKPTIALREALKRHLEI